MQLFVQSFLNAAERLTLEVLVSDSIESVKASIESEEGVSVSLMELYFEGTLLEDGNTLNDYGIQDGDYVSTSNTISTLATKELRQKAKLDLAALKRSDTYDITQLPTQYDDNNIIDNPNTGGLVERRPWNTP